MKTGKRKKGKRREGNREIESVEINKGTGRIVSGNNAVFFSNWLLTDATARGERRGSIERQW